LKGFPEDVGVDWYQVVFNVPDLHKRVVDFGLEVDQRFNHFFHRIPVIFQQCVGMLVGLLVALDESVVELLGLLPFQELDI
jgi:hypothetical protein